MSEDIPLLSPETDYKHKRGGAYLVSAISCLLSASFTVFSLYTDVFQNQLGYTPLEVNYISISGELGLYLCVPLLGYIADAYRLSYLGLIGTTAYAIGYCGCAYVVRTGGSFVWMSVFFGIVGIGCSAVFIASLVNCARLFPKSALLAISLPTTFYGLSSLLYARLISSGLKHGLDTSTLFYRLAASLSVVGIAAFIAPRMGHVDDPQESGHPELRDVEVAESHIKRFFKDQRTLILLFSFFLVSGPLEMYQNNLGLLVKAGRYQAEVAAQVGLFSGFSTLSRLLLGAAVDWFRLRPPVVLLAALVILAAIDLLFANGLLSISVTSSISGSAYGAAFTLYPLIVSHVWGITGFATYWGMFILGPAIGSFVFGIIFAANVERSSNYATTFVVCGFVAIISSVIVYRLRFHHLY